LKVGGANEVIRIISCRRASRHEGNSMKKPIAERIVRTTEIKPLTSKQLENLRRLSKRPDSEIEFCPQPAFE
jgi:hypothetical protein